ncbi:hypothetical protein GGS23DRAFT_530228 [Durotheca rogersii]|uniref:uncharacterized protein n=1 Tax=Durotheca rogersii TaxID=419775 RepID=UPI00221EF3D0|nr:uncharacterized protein GGS23DRAFT_530228 [Durotheca rogersii]KAI5863379.1 hypothetical protein GGS23DRAFT_530228 [Durotheca rogersii]
MRRRRPLIKPLRVSSAYLAHACLATVATASPSTVNIRRGWVGIRIVRLRRAETRRPVSSSAAQKAPRGYHPAYVIPIRIVQDRYRICIVEQRHRQTPEHNQRGFGCPR